MTSQHPGNGPNRRRLCGAILERLVRNLLDYSQRFLDRHGMHTVTISAQLHYGYVVKVTHCNAVTFQLPRASEHHRAATALAYKGSQRGFQTGSLSPDEINARLGLRLSRLLRHFAVHFGALHIEVDDDGRIETICPSLPFRPAELEELARLLSNLPQEKPPQRSTEAGSVVLEPNIGRQSPAPSGGRRNSGALV